MIPAQIFLRNYLASCCSNRLEHHKALSEEFLKDHLEYSSRSLSNLPDLSHKSMPTLLSTLGNGAVSNYSMQVVPG